MIVSRLPDIQDAFQRYMLTGDSDIRSLVVGTDRVPVEVRLGIYGDGYVSRLVESLQATFPVLARLLGESEFRELGDRYVRAHDSTFPSIRYYGDQLARFLATEPSYSKAPVLAEIARWEWAMAAVFDAADAQPIDTSAFAEVAPEEWAQLRFQWSPALEMLELEWNVPEIWKEGPPFPDPELCGTRTWLIWRRDLQIFFRPLAVPEAAVITASASGQSFGELCELLCEHLPESEASLQAAGYLRGWVQSGLIVSIGEPKDAPATD